MFLFKTAGNERHTPFADTPIGQNHLQLTPIVLAQSVRIPGALPAKVTPVVFLGPTIEKWKKYATGRGLTSQ